MDINPSRPPGDEISNSIFPLLHLVVDTLTEVFKNTHFPSPGRLVTVLNGLPGTHFMQVSDGIKHVLSGSSFEVHRFSFRIIAYWMKSFV